MLAVDAGVPIVPVTIRGTHAIMMKRTWIIRPQAVAVEVGEPIDTSACTRATKEALMERVRAAIVNSSFAVSRRPRVASAGRRAAAHLA